MDYTPPKLSPRDARIAEYLLDGLSEKEIADLIPGLNRLDVYKATRRICQSIGIQHASQLTNESIRMGRIAYINGKAVPSFLDKLEPFELRVAYMSAVEGRPIEDIDFTAILAKTNCCNPYELIYKIFLSGLITRNADQFEQLNPSEQVVASLAARGLTCAEIAVRLDKSVHTVKNQLNAVYRNLNINRQNQLILLAIDCGITTAREGILEWEETHADSRQGNHTGTN